MVKRVIFWASFYSEEKECAVVGRSVMSDFATPRTEAHQAPLSMGILQVRILEWVAISFSKGSPDPGVKPRPPTLQEDSLLSEPLGKPKNTIPSPGYLPNTGIESGLLHCRQIIYQLSYNHGFYVKLPNMWNFTNDPCPILILLYPKSLRTQKILRYFLPFLLF